MYKKIKVKYWKHVHKEYKKEFKEMYKERKEDYIVVYMFDTLEEMYKYGNKLDRIILKEKDSVTENDYSARTYNNIKFYEDEHGNFIKYLKCCGKIMFNCEDISQDYVAHESTHAVLNYLSYFLKDTISDIFNEESENYEKNNELIAYMIGGLCEDITDFILNYDKVEKYS